MSKLKSLKSSGRNLKFFFHDQAELLSDHPAGSASRQKLAFTKRPKSKPAAAKSDQRTRWNRPKTISVTEVVHQPDRSGREKKDGAATPYKDANAKIHSLGIDKNCHPGDSKAQLNHAAVEIENELLCDELEFSVPYKSKKGKHHSTIELEEKLQNNVPLSDPICCFTSNDEEMTHAPTRKVKRPFEEVIWTGRQANMGRLKVKKEEASVHLDFKKWLLRCPCRKKKKEQAWMQPVSELPLILILSMTLMSKRELVRASKETNHYCCLMVNRLEAIKMRPVSKLKQNVPTVSYHYLMESPLLYWHSLKNLVMHRL